MKGSGKKMVYTAAELRWVKRHRTMPRRQAHAAFCEIFGRPDVTFENYKSLCTRRGWLTGRTGCFQLGQVSWNKGGKMPYNAASARTQFKKGNAPHNTKYAGHERIEKDGYILISINETNPRTGFSRRYVLKHKYLWEQQHGPLPKGMCLKCLDGNRTNTDPSNWEAIPRGVNALLNGRWALGFDQAAPEARRALITLATLKWTAKHRFTKRKKSKGRAA